MYGGYQRVPSGASDCSTEYFLPRSPGPSSSASEASFNEKQSTANATAELLEASFADVSVKLRTYLRSRGLWLYDISRCLGGTTLAPILPSFLRPRALSDNGGPISGGSPHANGIATLDGVRGFACFFVFNFHFLFMYTLTSVRGYGVDPTGSSNRWVHQLPFIKLLYGGRSMVCVFFVLSGYVLSRKPLMTVRSQSYDSMLQSLSSSIFRRGIRLFLPTIISTFIVMLTIRAGLFVRATEIAQDGVTMAFVEHHPVRFGTWQEQAWDYWNFVSHYIDFTNWGEWYNLYDPHVWTIPLEYRASMVLFVALVCFARARTGWRLFLMACFMIFCGRWGRFEIVLFLAGAFLAELDLITNTWGTPPHRSSSSSSNNNSSSNITTSLPLPITATPPRTPPPRSPCTPPPSTSEKVFCPRSPTCHAARAALHYALFTLGLYLLSFPDEYGDFTPGYAYLSLHIPAAYRANCAYRFWQSVGAVSALYAINNSPALRRPFLTPLAQYLGRISYAFYLVHGPVVHSLGFVTMRTLFAWGGRYKVEEGQVLLPGMTPKVVEAGTMGDHAFAAWLFVGWAFLLAVSVWLADVFWRLVDVPCVKLARWLEMRVMRRDA
ncbi:acyltransferase family-domain-containing protein [Macrophomina phaseolina]|uniref:Acyltransferase family-domain-containing protein n=1 Tax=Macrophomina phaseolina TaxID=35725 RepID=A0ABQ8G5J2_9PEZI|nr:acyltransferase family-domain-containing protein [Macrophomina phaseolina]